MNARINHLDAVVSQSLAHERKTGSELREMIGTLNAALFINAEPDDLEQLAKDIEARLGITMGLGAMVDDADFQPWLDGAKASIEPFYWERYKKLQLKNGLPQEVVTSADIVTDRILVVWETLGWKSNGTSAEWSSATCRAARRATTPASYAKRQMLDIA